MSRLVEVKKEGSAYIPDRLVPVKTINGSSIPEKVGEAVHSQDEFINGLVESPAVFMEPDFLNKLTAHLAALEADVGEKATKSPQQIALAAQAIDGSKIKPEDAEILTKFTAQIFIAGLAAGIDYGVAKTSAAICKLFTSKAAP